MHPFFVTLIAENLSQSIVAAVCDTIGREHITSSRWLAPTTAFDITCTAPDKTRLAGMIATVIKGAPIDVAIQPFTEHRRKKLLIADMDSTILTGESLDEMAAFVGLKEPIAAITQRAMYGEISFKEALRERVSMLKGLPVQAIEETLASMEFSKGAATLLKTLKANGCYCALVSGGFQQFTQMVQDTLGFDENKANVLLVADGKLTGLVQEPILDKQAKLDALERLVAQQGVRMEDALAVGDGANDLAMITAAGLGIAYKAKPSVAAVAPIHILHTDLVSLLYVQGYGVGEINLGSV
jgi:phosphoserine phosphatase